MEFLYLWEDNDDAKTTSSFSVPTKGRSEVGSKVAYCLCGETSEDVYEPATPKDVNLTRAANKTSKMLTDTCPHCDFVRKSLPVVENQIAPEWKSELDSANVDYEGDDTRSLIRYGVELIQKHEDVLDSIPETTKIDAVQKEVAQHFGIESDAIGYKENPQAFEASLAGIFRALVVESLDGVARDIEYQEEGDHAKQLGLWMSVMLQHFEMDDKKKKREQATVGKEEETGGDAPADTPAEGDVPAPSDEELAAADETEFDATDGEEAGDATPETSEPVIDAVGHVSDEYLTNLLGGEVTVSGKYGELAISADGMFLYSVTNRSYASDDPEPQDQFVYVRVDGSHDLITFNVREEAGDPMRENPAHRPDTAKPVLELELRHQSENRTLVNVKVRNPQALHTNLLLIDFADPRNPITHEFEIDPNMRVNEKVSDTKDQAQFTLLSHKPFQGVAEYRHLKPEAQSIVHQSKLTPDERNTLFQEVKRAVRSLGKKANLDTVLMKMFKRSKGHIKGSYQYWFPEDGQTRDDARSFKNHSPASRRRIILREIGYEQEDVVEILSQVFKDLNLSGPHTESSESLDYFMKIFEEKEESEKSELEKDLERYL